MKKTEHNLILLNLIFVVSLVITNVTACKVIDFFAIGNIPIRSGAALTYAFTFLCTDIIGELWGKQEANLCVKRGLWMQIFALFLIIGIQYLPTQNQIIQNAYETLLGQNVWFVTASMTAYLCAQKWDVWIFHKIRDKFVNKDNDFTKHRWIWNNASTATSQIIDTCIYVFIGFGIGCRWFKHDNFLYEIIGIAIGQYCIKLLLAIIDTPFFYLFTKTEK